MDRTLHLGIGTLSQRNHNGEDPQTAQEPIEFYAALTDEAIRNGTFGKIIPVEKRKWNKNKTYQGPGRNGNSFKKPANAIRTFAATQTPSPNSATSWKDRVRWAKPEM
jgi:nicotinamide mononucleotide adenylyltransferase